MRMLVLGAGISGRGAISLASRLGYEVAVYDRDPAALADLVDVTTHAGDWQAGWLQRVDVVVASPGIPEHAEPIASALETGIPIWGELEFAARHLTAPIVAVTGTNGKTTVTTLIAGMLEASGVAAAAAGNIGTALTDLVGSTPDLIVVEVSSFQLRFIEKFSPAVAVLLNIAPDHLDWHQTFDRYREAKANLIKNAGRDIPLIFDVDDPEARAVAVNGAAQQVPVSGIKRVPGGWGVDGDRLVLDGLELPLDEIPIDDPAYLLDLAAAGTAALIAGADPEAVAKIIRTFEPVVHRRTVVGTWAGITWIDDSKATNPHSALAAVAAYPSVVLIAGGRNKGLDLAPIVTHRNLRSLIAIGEAAQEILGAAERIPSIEAESMEEAVAAAKSLARPGDVVLLAPGCASFDMFDNYEQRGDVFRQAVRDMEEGK
jgi:UDP-N-acetylmuramoylalanine--D-glutamate ligase